MIHPKSNGHSYPKPVFLKTSLIHYLSVPFSPLIWQKKVFKGILIFLFCTYYIQYKSYPFYLQNTWLFNYFLPSPLLLWSKCSFYGQESLPQEFLCYLDYFLFTHLMLCLSPSCSYNWLVRESLLNTIQIITFPPSKSSIGFTGMDSSPFFSPSPASLRSSPRLWLLCPLCCAHSIDIHLYHRLPRGELPRDSAPALPLPGILCLEVLSWLLPFLLHALFTCYLPREVLTSL